jgi:hypothetical protein
MRVSPRCGVTLIIDLLWSVPRRQTRHVVIDFE